MVRYDPYTDSFIDNPTKETTATINLDAFPKSIIQMNVVEVSDASIEKIADAVVRKLADRKTEPQTNKDFEVTYTCSFTDCDNFKNFGFGEKCIECKRKQSEAKYKDEPQICDTCRYYNSNIPCGSTPSACKEADKFAEEFVDALKKLKPTISKMEQVEDEPQTDCSWK